MNETIVERAKRLVKQPDLCLSSHEMRELLRDLVIEIEARDAAVAEGCIGEYCDVALVHHVRALVSKHIDRLNGVARAEA